MTARRRSSTHLDARGRAHMVDVGSKPLTARRARARGRVRMSASALDAVRRGNVPKGDVRAVARLAGIQAAKQTASLLPLCHPLPLDAIDVDIRIEARAVAIEASVACRAATGVEMEAIVAVCVAAAAVYDMCKSLDRGMVIEEILLLEKSGGRSGHYRRGSRA